MFDIGWQELFIVAVIGIIVIGPKDLPRAIAQISKWLRKARSIARDFQSGLDDVIREAELDDIRKQVEAASDLDIKKQLENSIDPDGILSADLDPKDGESAAKGVADATPGETPKIAKDPAGATDDGDEPAPADDTKPVAADKTAETPTQANG